MIIEGPGAMNKNPFELVTASKLTATAAVDLWCDDKRLARISGKENCFVNGHRGTGKSMLFRILQHDCQKLLHPKVTPTFIAVYFSVRDTEFLTEELDLFQDDAQRTIISESHFSLMLAKQLFLILEKDASLIPTDKRKTFINVVEAAFQTAYQYSPSENTGINRKTFSTFIDDVIAMLERERVRIVQYIGLRIYDKSPFTGPLFLFDSLLGPIGDYFRQRLGQSIYILIDDGDDLPLSHTIVLNSWIARRHASIVFKISTMFGYKTYATRTRSAIQHPHDFFQYEIATRYISDSGEDYVELLRDICRKRLTSVGIETSPGLVDPDAFFPEDTDQQKAMAKLAKTLEVTYSKTYKGRQIRDKVYRHLASEYMQSLAKRRSPGSFVYSGFKTLAILSSGLVRDFIICAQRMFDNASRLSNKVNQIPPKVQNEVVRLHADQILEEIPNPKQKRARDSSREDWQSIHRLVAGLGTLYKAKMYSKDSERRVFSFSFQNEPDEKLERLLDLAIAEGYLTKGFMSKKEGTGRRILYVLTRRLAPAYHLDVSAYNGYLSLTADRVELLSKRGPNRTDLQNPGREPTLFRLVDSESESEDNDWTIISPEEAGV